MKLEFLDDIIGGGKFTEVVTDQLIRLFDFDKSQASKLRQEIKQSIIEKEESLDFTKLDFIQTINCKLILCIGEIDIGITTGDKINFTCYLSKTGYENMINLLEPFCSTESEGYQWLYDVNTPIDFLFSPGGTW